MQIRNNFKMEIKPYEWLYIVATIIIMILLYRGDLQTAVELLSRWLPKPK